MLTLPLCDVFPLIYHLVACSLLYRVFEAKIYIYICIMTNKSWSFNNNSSNKLFDLTGTVALITGGNSGIGRGIAILVLRKPGADIFIASRNVEKSRAVCQEIIKLTNRKAYCTWCEYSSRCHKNSERMSRTVHVQSFGYHLYPMQEYRKVFPKICIQIKIGITSSTLIHIPCIGCVTMHIHC